MFLNQLKISHLSSLGFATTLATASYLFAQTHLVAQYATSVVDYSSGSGFSPKYTNAASALGQPSRVTEGLFGCPVNPFAPPYTPDQLVSLGAGGSLTIRFSPPILNSDNNPFGLDFSVFGSAGFMVTNSFDTDFNYIGTPATDGTLFNPSSANTRVSVSTDGSFWYILDPSKTPKVDDRFPTDGSGDFTHPINPSLLSTSLSGKTLTDLRLAYGGSAGGAGFDLSWALNSSGKPVSLESASFVRIEVLSGRTEIDGLAAVIALPEPGAVLLALKSAEKQVVFEGKSGWIFILEASSDFNTWTPINKYVAHTDGEVRLSDLRRAYFPTQFYRVKATRL
ncbi:MAG: hypothetical protein EXS25_06145 [Pedosphaera sp.]|nr:hypothetical protein [Pedosphaera sp.]